MTDITALKAANARRWNNIHIRPDRKAVFAAQARKLIDPVAKARYVGVTNRLRQLGFQPVPWWFVAIVSVREYGGPPRWDKQLGQGDPLNRVSVHDPRGRGPFLDHPTDTTPGNDAWTRCCIDALVECAPHAAKWTDWSPGGTMTIFEEYNGTGYANMGVPSAYVWSGSDQYVSGKYIRDHVYDPHTVDVQLGCAPLLKAMMELDATITLTGATITPMVPTGISQPPSAIIPAPLSPKAKLPPPAVTPPVVVPAVIPQSGLGTFLKALFGLFTKRK